MNHTHPNQINLTPPTQSDLTMHTQPHSNHLSHAKHNHSVQKQSDANSSQPKLQNSQTQTANLQLPFNQSQENNFHTYNYPQYQPHNYSYNPHHYPLQYQNSYGHNRGYHGHHRGFGGHHYRPHPTFHHQPQIYYSNYPHQQQVKQIYNSPQQDYHVSSSNYILHQNIAAEQVHHRKQGGWGRKCGKGRWRRSHSHSHSHSDSRSSSSSSYSSERIKEGKKKSSQINKQQVRVNYEKGMNGFFQSRQINEKQREKMLRILVNRLPNQYTNINKLIQYFQFMQQEKLTFRMPYVKILKVLIRFGFDLSEAVPKIQKIQKRRIKKFEADLQFNVNHGDKQLSPLMDVNDLILSSSNSQNIKYLVDGNNIMPTNKHFRRYFQSQSKMDRVAGQIRCQWYLSHCFPKENIILFFDQRFDDSEYNIVKQQLPFSKAELVQFNGISVIYGNGKKADDMIVQKVIELKGNEQKWQMILVSADRELNVRCQQAASIMHTSGKYFLKYCKYLLNRKYKGEKDMKRKSKQIIRYCQQKQDFY